jgi:hypothetical protein
MSSSALVDTAELLPLSAFKKTHRANAATLRGYCCRPESDPLYLKNAFVGGRYLVSLQSFEDWLVRMAQHREAKRKARKDRRDSSENS